MATVRINTFDGGQAQDIRTHATNEHTTSVNFDVFSDPHLLQPYYVQVADTSSGTINDYNITDVDIMTIAGSTNLIGMGKQDSTHDYVSFFRKNNVSDITTAWTQYVSSSGYNQIAGTLCVYKGNAYALAYNGTTVELIKWDGTGGALTNIGALGGSYNSSVPVARPFVHPEDNVLYMVAGNIISKYDGSSFVGTAFTLPNSGYGVSLTSYGTNLAVATRPVNSWGDSMVYLWGRQTTVNTTQGNIRAGKEQINSVTNINNVLIMVMSSANAGSYSTVLDGRLIIRGYAGGAVETIKNMPFPAGGGSNNFRMTKDDKLYFGFSNDTAIYVFGKNDSGQYFCSHDRKYPANISSVTGLSFVGDYLFTSYTKTSGSPATGFLAVTSTSAYGDSSYTTAINQAMPLEDRYKHKQLEAIYVAVKFGNTCTVSYSWDGGATNTIISDSTSTTGSNVTLYATNENSATPFEDGYELTITVAGTGNMQVKEIGYRYSILDTVL